MACIYKNDCDDCTLYEADQHEGLTSQNSSYGFSADDDAKGKCAVDEDPDPFHSCEMFEPTDPSEYEDCGDGEY